MITVLVRERRYVRANDYNVLKALRSLQCQETVFWRDILREMECEVSESTLKRSLKRLNQSGMITIHGIGKSGGRRYQILEESCPTS